MIAVRIGPGQMQFTVMPSRPSSTAIERVSPVGYSLGGPVAQLMWRHHRDRVDGLVLCATSRNFRGKPHERWGFWSLWGALTALRLADALPWPRRSPPLAMQPPAPEMLDGVRLPRWAIREMLRCDPVAMIGAAYALGHFTSHEWVGSIYVPAAVVVTLRDQLVSPSRQRSSRRRYLARRSIPPIRTTPRACSAPDASCPRSSTRAARSRIVSVTPDVSPDRGSG